MYGPYKIEMPVGVKISELLIQAKAKIDTPEKFLRNVYCNAPTYEESTCFCSYGAINAVLGRRRGDSDVNPVSEALGRVIPGGTEAIHRFNDRNEHAAVMLKFDQAIMLQLMVEHGDIYSDQAWDIGRKYREQV